MGGQRTRKVLGTATCLVAVLAPAASAQAGGAASPDQDGASGGVEYGTPSGAAANARPVVGHFTVAPVKLRADKAPRVRLRVDEEGGGKVTARLVFWPASKSAKVLVVPLGAVRTGRTMTASWPSGTQLQPGRYVVRLHAKDARGRTLQRRRRASGRAALTVVAAPRPKPAPAPAPAPSTPEVRGGGFFPVAGAHTYGEGFGADRGDHRHEGVDLLADAGTPVVAPLAGTVRVTDFQESGAGEYVVMDAGDGRSFVFNHCTRGSTAVKPGQAVTAGTRLCAVGSTGRSTANHLHFEIWEGGWRTGKDSHPVDPLPQLKAWDGAGGSR